MARLLYIGSGNPWRGGAGYLVRQNLFLGALAQISELHLAMFDCDGKSVPEFVKELTLLSKPTRGVGPKWKNLAEDWMSPLPRMVRGYDLSAPRQQAMDLKLDSFDAVFSYRIDFGYFAGVLGHPRLILDIDDPEHLRGKRRLAAMGVPADRRTKADLEKLAGFERQAVAGAKLAFVCQENDRKGWDTPPEVVPNCVEVLANPARKPDRPIVLFVGNCAGGPASPNVDAVKYFLTDIWPRVLQSVPEAEFQLVGAASDLVCQLAAGAERTKLRGFVDNLADVYAEACVSVAPIRFGTGTRIKILEAFAHACPVVSTLAGAEGIEAVPGREIELAADAGEFAERIVALLRDRPLAEEIGAGGHRLAISKYDAAAQQKLLVARLSRFLEEKAG